jgi:hypothetical protein
VAHGVDPEFKLQYHKKKSSFLQHWDFELRALHLLGRCSTTLAFHQLSVFPRKSFLGLGLPSVKQKEDNLELRFSGCGVWPQVS